MKFFWNGQLVRTSKTHVYSWAVLWVNDDGTFKCRACRKDRADADAELHRLLRTAGDNAKQAATHLRVVPLDSDEDNRALSFAEFMALAKANYAKGGDTFVECWDENTYEYWTREFGAFTKVSALQAFELSRSSMKRDEAGRGR